MNVRRLIVPVLAVAAAFACAPPAPAQFGDAAGLGQVMNPYYLRRDLQLFANGLGLDDGQAAIVESLFWDYEDAQTASKDRMMARFGELQDELQNLQGDKDKLLEVVFEPIQDQADDWDRLNEQFLQNVQAILSSQQLERWDEFLRELRREKELPGGKFSGEALNLFHVLRDLDIDKRAREGAQSACDTYSITLDSALRRRQKTLLDSRQNMYETLRDSASPEAMRVMRVQTEARTAVRDANLDHIDVIAQALPSDVAAEFRTRALQDAFPRAYRATAGARLFKSAIELEAITEEIRAAIETLYAAYTSELDTISARIASLIKAHQPQQALERAQNYIRRQNGQAEEHTPDPTREAFRERQELDRKYADLLRDLLTEEQFTQLDGARRFLPQPEEDNEMSPIERKRRMMENERRPGLGASRPDGNRGAGKGGS